MSFHADTFWSRIEPGDGVNRLSTRQTTWGLVISEVHAGRDWSAVAEGALKVISIAVIFSAIAIWAVPGGALGSAPLAAKLGMTASFFFVGFAAYQHAARGFNQEIHIDTSRREVRLATRNANGMSRVRRSIPMSNIESCFINRTKSRKGPSYMLLRLKGRQQPFAVAKGSEASLVPILERLAAIVKNSQRGFRA